MTNLFYGGILGPSMSSQSSINEEEIEKIINEVKSQGVFDDIRRDCISDVDTKPAYQNLKSRVETSIQKFLDKCKFDTTLNKNVVRENLRKHVIESAFYNPGLDRITDQIVNPKVMPVLYPKVEKIVCEHLNVPYVPSTTTATQATLPQGLSYANTNGSLTNHIPSLILGATGSESLVTANSGDTQGIKVEPAVPVKTVKLETADVSPKSEPMDVSSLSGMSDLASHGDSDSGGALSGASTPDRQKSRRASSEKRHQEPSEESEKSSRLESIKTESLETPTDNARKEDDENSSSLDGPPHDLSGRLLAKPDLLDIGEVDDKNTSCDELQARNSEDEEIAELERRREELRKQMEEAGELLESETEDRESDRERGDTLERKEDHNDHVELHSDGTGNDGIAKENDSKRNVGYAIDETKSRPKHGRTIRSTFKGKDDTHGGDGDKGDDSGSSDEDDRGVGVERRAKIARVAFSSSEEKSQDSTAMDIDETSQSSCKSIQRGSESNHESDSSARNNSDKTGIPEEDSCVEEPDAKEDSPPFGPKDRLYRGASSLLEKLERDFYNQNKDDDSASSQEIKDELDSSIEIREEIGSSVEIKANIGCSVDTNEDVESKPEVKEETSVGLKKHRDADKKKSDPEKSKERSDRDKKSSRHKNESRDRHFSEQSSENSKSHRSERHRDSDGGNSDRKSSREKKEIRDSSHHDSKRRSLSKESKKDSQDRHRKNSHRDKSKHSSQSSKSSGNERSRNNSREHSVQRDRNRQSEESRSKSSRDKRDNSRDQSDKYEKSRVSCREYEDSRVPDKSPSKSPERQKLTRSDVRKNSSTRVGERDGGSSKERRGSESKGGRKAAGDGWMRDSSSSNAVNEPLSPSCTTSRRSLKEQFTPPHVGVSSPKQDFSEEKPTYSKEGQKKIDHLKRLLNLCNQRIKQNSKTKHDTSREKNKEYYGDVKYRLSKADETNRKNIEYGSKTTQDENREEGNKVDVENKDMQNKVDALDRMNGERNEIDVKENTEVKEDMRSNLHLLLPSGELDRKGDEGDRKCGREKNEDIEKDEDTETNCEIKTIGIPVDGPGKECNSLKNNILPSKIETVIYLNLFEGKENAENVETKELAEASNTEIKEDSSSKDQRNLTGALSEDGEKEALSIEVHIADEEFGEGKVVEEKTRDENTESKISSKDLNTIASLVDTKDDLQKLEATKEKEVEDKESDDRVETHVTNGNREEIVKDVEFNESKEDNGMEMIDNTLRNQNNELVCTVNKEEETDQKEIIEEHPEIDIEDVVKESKVLNDNNEAVDDSKSKTKVKESYVEKYSTGESCDKLVVNERQEKSQSRILSSDETRLEVQSKLMDETFPIPAQTSSAKLMAKTALDTKQLSNEDGTKTICETTPNGFKFNTPSVIGFTKSTCLKKLVEINMWDREKKDASKQNRVNGKRKAGNDKFINVGDKNKVMKEHDGKMITCGKLSAIDNKDESIGIDKLHKTETTDSNTNVLREEKSKNMDSRDKWKEKLVKQKKDYTQEKSKELKTKPNEDKAKLSDLNKPKVNPNKKFQKDSPRKDQDSDTITISLDPDELGIDADVLISALQVSVTITDCKNEKTLRKYFKDRVEKSNNEQITPKRNANVNPMDEKNSHVRETSKNLSKTADSYKSKKTASSLKEMMKISKERQLKKQRSQEKGEETDEEENKTHTNDSNRNVKQNVAENKELCVEIDRYEMIKCSVEKRLTQTILERNRRSLQVYLQKVQNILDTLKKKVQSEIKDVQSETKHTPLEKSQVHDEKTIEHLNNHFLDPPHLERLKEAKILMETKLLDNSETSSMRVKDSNEASSKSKENFPQLKAQVKKQLQKLKKKALMEQTLRENDSESAPKPNSSSPQASVSPYQAFNTGLNEASNTNLNKSFNTSPPNLVSYTSPDKEPSSKSQSWVKLFASTLEKKIQSLENKPSQSSLDSKHPSSNITVPSDMMCTLLLDRCDTLARHHVEKQSQHKTKDTESEDVFAAIKRKIAQEIRNKTKTSPSHYETSPVKQITSSAIVDLKELRMQKNDVITVYNANHTVEKIDSKRCKKDDQNVSSVTSTENSMDTGGKSVPKIFIDSCESEETQRKSCVKSIFDENDDFVKRYVKPLMKTKSLETSKICQEPGGNVNLNVLADTAAAIKKEHIYALFVPNKDVENESVDIENSTAYKTRKLGVYVPRDELNENYKENYMVDTINEYGLNKEQPQNDRDSTEEDSSTEKDMKTNAFEKLQHDFYNNQQKYEEQIRKTMEKSPGGNCADKADNEMKDSKSRIFDALEEFFYTSPSKYKEKAPKKQDESKMKENDTNKMNEDKKRKIDELKTNLFEKLQRDYYRQRDKDEDRKIESVEDRKKKVEKKIKLFETLQQDFYNNQENKNEDDKTENREDIIELDDNSGECGNTGNTDVNKDNDSRASIKRDDQHENYYVRTGEDQCNNNLEDSTSKIDGSNGNKMKFVDNSQGLLVTNRSNTFKQVGSNLELGKLSSLGSRKTTERRKTSKPFWMNLDDLVVPRRKKHASKLVEDSSVSTKMDEINSSLAVERHEIQHSGKSNLIQDEKIDDMDVLRVEVEPIQSKAFAGFEVTEKIAVIKKLHSLTDIFITLEQFLASTSLVKLSVEKKKKKRRYEMDTTEMTDRKKWHQDNETNRDVAIERSIRSSYNNIQPMSTKEFYNKTSGKNSNRNYHNSLYDEFTDSVKMSRRQRASEESSGYGSVDQHVSDEDHDIDSKDNEAQSIEPNPEPRVPSIIIRRKRKVTSDSSDSSNSSSTSDSNSSDSDSDASGDTEDENEEDSKERLGENGNSEDRLSGDEERLREDQLCDKEERVCDNKVSFSDDGKISDLRYGLSNEDVLNNKDNSTRKECANLSVVQRILMSADEENGNSEPYTTQSLQSVLDDVNNDINDHVFAQVKILPRPPRRPPAPMQQRYDASDLYKPRLTFTSKRRKLDI